jgi:hypothetical protein
MPSHVAPLAVENMQPQLLFPMSKIELKSGKQKCPACGKLQRSYCKTLDDRLTNLAYEALDFLCGNQKKIFRVRDVFKDNHQKINDFQKLGYWRIFERVEKRAGWWKITQTGYRFLVGGYSLPRKLWVYNRKVVEQGNELINAETAKKRWQETRSDWTLDYMSHQYKKEITIGG